MSLFRTKDRIQELKERGTNALNVFRQTVTELSSVNEEIDTEIELRDTQIEVLKNEKSMLNEAKKENGKFITKINEFLN